MFNRVLLLTAQPADAELLTKVLENATADPFSVVWQKCLADGLEQLTKGDTSAIMATLSLPDSAGIETFDRLLAAAPHTPIMILCAPEDENLAREAIQRGAQGYLSRGEFSSNLVPQALHSMHQAPTGRAGIA